MLGIQIQRTVSRSNSAVRTASVCSQLNINSHNSVLRIINHPKEQRISRTQNRFNSSIRSLSHPTDVASFVALNKANKRFSERNYTTTEDYEENEEVAEEQAVEEDVVEQEKADEDEFEAVAPKFAKSFMPYFQRNKADQFRENEGAENLNRQAFSKYARAVEDSTKAETTRYRLEMAKPPVDEDDGQSAIYNVADVYREHFLKREKTFFPHLQPSNMKPFGSTDSLFFPFKSNKDESFPTGQNIPEIPEEIPTTSGSTKSGSSSPQQREYSTIHDRRRGEKKSHHHHHQHQQKRNVSNDLGKAKKERQESVRVKVQERLCAVSAIQLDEQEMVKKIEAKTTKTNLHTMEPKVTLRSSSRYNVLQSSLEPEEVAFLDVKPGRNERVIPPWPAYSETLQKPYTPLTVIRYPKKTITASSKSESLQAREFSTGRRKPSAKKVIKRFGCSNIMQYSSMDDRPDCPKPKKPIIQNGPPLKRLKRKKIKPRKQCVIKKVNFCPPTRADAALTVKSKKLPKIVSSGLCKPLEPKLKDCAPLKRLKKVGIPEPSRCVTAKAPKICSTRADDDLVFEKKPLPVLKAQNCPKIESKPMKDIKLPRLKKVKVQQPRVVCPKKRTYCPPSRADDALKIKPKQLPRFKAMECPKVPPAPMKDLTPLRRFKKVIMPEPAKVCVKKKTFCPPKRADDGLKVRAKSLPTLPPEDCPKPPLQAEPPCNPLKRLPKMKPYDPPKCKIVKKAECTTKRADEGLKVVPKQLPGIEAGGGCKPEPEKMKEGEPLMRLPKRNVAEPVRCVAPKARSLCSERADGKIVVAKKSLPKLACPACPSLETPPMKDVLLPRLKKVDIPEPPKVCQIKEAECITPRADDGVKMHFKPLPIIKGVECLQIEPEPMKELEPLPRLPKITIKEPPKICKPKRKFCPDRRADDGLQVESKSLPFLEAADCEKPPAPPMKEGNPIHRLPKMPFYDPPKCKIVKKMECAPSARADANLKVESKSLPHLVAHGSCKPEPPQLKDCKPLKKLRKQVVPEPKRCVIIKKKECTVERADADWKMEKKQLPKLEVADCPKVPAEIMKDVELPRLKKVEIKEPPKICVQVKVECSKRADEDWKMEKKQLPELKIPECPKLKPKPLKDVELVRLKKVVMDEPKKLCPKPKSAECLPRSDEISGYQIKKKPLKPVILSEKYNEISFRHFNKKSSKKKAPYFKTKRDYHRVMTTTRSYSNRVYYHPKKKLKTSSIYRGNSQKSDCEEVCPKPLCPKPPQKTLWQRICDYFKARPGCPPPDAWKKKMLRERAEKAAKAAGLYLCECPCAPRKQMTIKRKKPPCDNTCTKNKEKSTCPKFKMPYCNEAEVRVCEKEIKPIPCEPPLETPYPSFSAWKCEMEARKMNECKVADKKMKAMKDEIEGMNNGVVKKNKKAMMRNYSTTSGFYSVQQKQRAARIIDEFDNELKKQTTNYDVLALW